LRRPHSKTGTVPLSQAVFGSALRAILRKHALENLRSTGGAAHRAVQKILRKHFFVYQKVWTFLRKQLAMRNGEGGSIFLKSVEISGRRVRALRRTQNII
jgi:hypothetical protein